MIFGIDISHHNTGLDWNKIAAANNPKIDFVMIKATQGVGYIDPMALEHSLGAKQIGRSFGHYHFASLNDVNVVADAHNEAVAFTNAMKNLPVGDLIPFLDIETDEANLPPDQVENWIESFMDSMNQLGHSEVGIYTGGWFSNDHLPQHPNHPFGKYLLWMSAYTSNPNPKIPIGWDKYTLWQYTDRAIVPGVPGIVDMDKTTSELFSLLKK